MKRITAFLFVLILVFTFSSLVSAESSVKLDSISKNDTIVVSEKDLIILWLNSTDEELKNIGYTDSEISEIRSYNFEELFLERANLPKETLDNYGYSESEIQILKSYTGEKITSNSDVLATTTHMNVSFAKSSYASNSKKVNFVANLEWNRVPIFKTTDLFVVTFRGVNPSSQYIDLVPTRREGLIRYYNLSDGVYHHNSPVTVTYDSIKTSAYSRIPMVKNDNHQWAKSGYISLELAPQNSNASINYVNLGAHFGHRTLHVSGSISFNVTGGVSVSFTPSASTITSGYRTGQVTSQGWISNNN